MQTMLSELFGMNNEKSKEFLFLGFAIPNEEMNNLVDLDKFPAMQTHKFNWNLIKGLELHGGARYTYVSARPISDYPNYPKIFIGKKKWNEIVDNNNHISILEIPFINVSILKIITRFFFGLYYSLKEFHYKASKSGVIVYSVHVPFMYIGYVMSKIYSIDFITIWTDPPSVVESKDRLIKSVFRKLELKLAKCVMKKSTKVVALTKGLAEDFAPNKPYIIIEGIIDEKDINTSIGKKNLKVDRNIIVAHTGSLSTRYGIQNIVRGVILTNDKNIELDIYGRGDYEEELSEICRNHVNIKYKGFLRNDEILRIQGEADFLINARSAEDDYVKYSFPSKTLEYMLSGTPLITTMLPGIPAEYEEYVIKLEDNSPATISETIKKAKAMKCEERELIGLKALTFARSKSFINQGKIIAEFIL